jgi:hypothetical protein
VQKNLADLLLAYDGAYFGTYQEKGHTANSATFSAMLKAKLKPAICSKRRLLSRTGLLHHNSACLHVAATILEKI